MSKNGEILSQLIENDFGIKGHDRWLKSSEHDSLVVDVDKGIFFWNSKDVVGDPIIYLTKVRGMPFKDATAYLSTLGYTGTHVWTMESGGDEIVVYPKLVEIFFESGRDKRDYFYRRGLTDSTIDRMQLGWYNGWNTVPFFEDGTFRNFQFRMDNPSKRIKSYYKGLGALLFNSDVLRLVNEVFWCEGPIDAMILIQNGIPAVSSNIGGGFKPEWYSKFINIERIWLVMDHDLAGDNESKKLAEFFGTSKCKIYNFWDFEEKGYDPVDYFRDEHTKDEFIELVNNNSKYLFEMEKYKRSKK